MSGVRIAVTGVGIVSPLGQRREQSWAALLAGQSAARWLDPVDLGIRCRSENFRWYGAPVVLHAPADETRPTQLALLASQEALANSRLTHTEQHSPATVIGTSKTDLNAVDRFFQSASAENIDEEHCNVRALYSNIPAETVANRLGLKGPLLCPVAACATGLVSLIRAAELIRHGDCQFALAGSTDSSLHPGLLASYRRLGVLAPPGTDPARACRPFDNRRSGFVVGEGAAALVMEHWDSAQRRGAAPIAEWIDGIVGCDPTGMTAVDDSGETLAHLIKHLLRRNRVEPQQISAVCYHGTATEMNDLTEARAIQNVFGKSPLGFGIKGAIGHLMGAAGAVETAMSVLAIRDQILPPTANHRHHDPACPNLVTGSEPIRQPIEYLLKTSLGFGGHLAVGLLKRVSR